MLHQSPEHVGTIMAVCRPVESFFDEAVTKICGIFHSCHLVPRPPNTTSTPDSLLTLDFRTLLTGMPQQRRHIEGLGAFPLFGSASNCGYSTELLQLLRYFKDEFRHNEMVGYTKYTQRHVYRAKITFSKLNFERFTFIFNNFRYTLSYAFSNAPTNTQHNRKFTPHRCTVYFFVRPIYFFNYFCYFLVFKIY